jgi:hypothetical protein
LQASNDKLFIFFQRDLAISIGVSHLQPNLNIIPCRLIVFDAHLFVC